MTVERAPTTAPDGLPPPVRWWAFLVIILGITLTVLDSGIVNLALPDIARDMKVSASAAVWVVIGYQIAALALLLPLANLGERIGYRRVYLVGAVVFTVGSLASMVADSMLLLVVARAFQGLGAAGIMSVNSALVRLTFPAAGLPRALALNSVVVAAGSVAGPPLGAAVLSLAPWPWLFALNVPLGILCFALGSRCLPANTHRPRAGAPVAALDVALNIATFSLFFLGADSLASLGGGGHAIVPPATGAAMLAAGVALAVWYVRRQRRLATPMLPIDLLAIPAFALSFCTSVATFSAHTLGFVALPFLLLGAQGFSHGHAGLLIAAWPAAVVVVAPIAGRLISRYPAGILGSIGRVMLSLGLLLLALLPDRAGRGDIAWRLALCGAGVAL
ncbi:MFS transporter, partial [Ramlibacter sp.]|uniref:MFS transporter n=1 Tax=Ramlibacter sp. TaxID=1917967 RepID=UPI003D12D5E2